MSVEAQVAKLEELLTRVQRNRGEGPTPSVASAAGSSASPVLAAPEIPAPSLGRIDSAPARGPKPTPMEMALLQESEEPEVSVDITIDAEEPEPEPEPEIVIEAEPPEESIPTAPVGTRAPVQMPEPATGKRPALSAVPAQSVPVQAAPVRAAPVQIAPTAAPSGPVARVVSRPEARTFGELLERALALRPR